MNRVVKEGPISRPAGLGNEVYEYILQQLMSLAIAPNERIGVDALARALGVSQTPIREALSQLEVQGLVVKTHLVGYRAAPQLTRKQFDDLCELRLLLEPAAAAKAATAMDDATLAEVIALSEAMEAPAASHAATAYSAFARKDAEFHAMIAAQSGNDLIHQIIVQQRTHLHLFRLRFYAQVTREAVTEHAAIVEAFRARDPAGAAAAMHSHIEKAHARFKAAYET
ncbi:GntR family transcriptional regulator [Chelatococcus sp. GCM10030263]|uniref:GntR family transcriptional regulator n=1 Tax=Chelatococcus sp. GCM10030263 TaxID=3273387 RepID=UPI00361AD469